LGSLRFATSLLFLLSHDSHTFRVASFFAVTSLTFGGVEAGSMDRGVNSGYAVERRKVAFYQYLTNFQEACLSLLKLEEFQLF